MKGLIIISMFFTLWMDLKSQTNIYNDYHGFPDPTVLNFREPDKTLVFDTCFASPYIQNNSDTIITNTCIEEYKSSGTLRKEKGPKINNKRFGNWTVQVGKNSWTDYYFNDYQIVKGDITDIISIDLKQKTAFCTFFYYNARKAMDTKMRIEFHLTDDDTVIAQCFNSEGVEIFKVAADDLASEIKLLFSGNHDKKIYGN